MISPDLIPVLSALQAGDKARARELLQSILKFKPTAEAWYLASRAMESADHEMICLQRALALDPYHVDVRRRIRALDASGVAAPDATIPRAVPQPTAPEDLAPDVARPQIDVSDEQMLPESINKSPLKKPNRRRKRGKWFYVGIIGSIVGSLAASYFVLTVLGSPVPSQIRSRFTGEEPVTEIDGVPLENVPQAVMQVEPAQTSVLTRSEPLAAALDPGFAHEYTFEAYGGDELAIGIQFFSPTAQRVNRNIAILDPSGRDAENQCERNRILQGDNGAAIICNIHQAGTWSLRLLGIEGQSTGAYVVTIERMR